ncbi:hypothetical protein ACWD6S_24515, partial [Streptomyces zhihengii]
MGGRRGHRVRARLHGLRRRQPRGRAAVDAGRRDRGHHRPGAGPAAQERRAGHLRLTPGTKTAAPVRACRVGVLEAGRRFTRESLPRNSWDLRNYLWAPA